MSRQPAVYFLFITTAIAYITSLTPLSHYTPQLIALSVILFLVANRWHLPTLSFISFATTLIVFTSGGLTSPFFFLIYFLLFSAAFTISPITSLFFALLLVCLLSQSLVTPTSLFSLVSLLFITPLVWLVSRESISASKTRQELAKDETDLLLWLNLKFKTGITTIIDLTSQLQSTPLTYAQKTLLKKVKDSSRNLLNSSQKLTQEISDENEDN